jgi:hypothetical protein
MGSAATIAPRPSALTVPSPPVIGLRLLVNNTNPARLWIPDGGRATITPAGKPAIAFTPHLSEGWLELVISEITEGAAQGAETKTEVGRLRLRRHAPVTFDGASVPMEIEWTELLPGRDDAEPPLGPCQTCCVLCEGYLFCACRVYVSCGSCCCSEVCLCEMGAASGTRPPSTSTCPGRGKQGGRSRG